MYFFRKYGYVLPTNEYLMVSCRIFEFEFLLERTSMPTDALFKHLQTVSYEYV